MPGHLRAVLFDAVGTLLRLREPVGVRYARVAERFGARLPADRLGEAFARAHAAAPPMVFPGADAGEIDRLERGWWRDVVRETLRAADPAATLRDFEACFEALYADFAAPGAWTLAPGARAALSALRARGLATGVVSNFDRRLRGLLAGLGLAPLLEPVVLPSDAGAAKPDPAIFRVALTALGCTAAECVYVGDDPLQDVAAARAAGLWAIDVGELATLADLPGRLASVSPPRSPE